MRRLLPLSGWIIAETSRFVKQNREESIVILHFDWKRKLLLSAVRKSMSLRGAAVPRKAATWQSPMVFRSVWGIATPVCATYRNDMRFNWCNCKLQLWLSALISKEDKTHKEKICHSEQAPARRGIFAFRLRLQYNRCQDPSTPLRSAQDDNCFGCLFIVLAD